MPSDWRRLTLREAGVELIDCDHRTPPAAESGFPYVAIPQLIDGRIRTAGARKISEQHFLEWTRKACPQGGDIVLSRRCNPGTTAFVPSGLQFALGQNLVLLRCNSATVDPKFLRWAVRGPEWWDEVNRFINVGAVFDSLRCRDIPEFTLSFPPLDQQRSIGLLLSLLDDRIESLREENQTLEAIARAIFKSWFVDFDPVKAKAEGREPEGMDAATAALFPSEFQDSEMGPIPKGWTRGTVSSLGDVICGKTPSTRRQEFYGNDVPLITIPDMHGKIFVSGTEKVLSKLGADSQSGKYLPRHSTSVSCIATPGLVVLNSRRAQTNQQINSVIPNGQFGVFFSYFTLRMLGNAIRQAGSGGSVFSNLSKGRFEQLQLVLPSAALAAAFDAKVAEMMLRIEVNGELINVLSSVRDALLPRLISGKLRVPEAEEMLV